MNFNEPNHNTLQKTNWYQTFIDFWLSIRTNTELSLCIAYSLLYSR